MPISLDAIARNTQGGELQADQARELLATWRSELAETTRRAYSRDLDLAAQAADLTGAPELLAHLVAGGKVAAELLAMTWRTELQARGLAPATIARRLSALRSAVGMLRRVGLVTWSIETKAPALHQVRDNRGPTLHQVRTLWGHLVLADHGRELGELQAARLARSRAVFRLLWDAGLRVGELVALDLESWSGRELTVAGKGGQVTRRELPEQTARELRAWIAVHQVTRSENDKQVPLFVSLETNTRGHRLTARAVRYWLGALGRRVLGAPVRPHGLRHAGVTARLDAGLELHTVQAWARHTSPATTAGYFDQAERDAFRAASVGALLLGGESAECQFATLPKSNILGSSNPVNLPVAERGQLTLFGGSNDAPIQNPD
jgi:integrase/recombinase XerC